jgi:signal transduction histidine kinase
MRAAVFPVVGLGAGFRNMADRLGALGGSLQVESAPQRGGTVSGAIPAGAGADAG